MLQLLRVVLFTGGLLVPVLLNLIQRLELLCGGEGGTYNCGYGTGFSVKQVVSAIEQATGKPLAVKIAPRRAGDPPEIVADPTLFREEFAWTPKYDDLALIVETALAWEKHLLDGMD